MGSEVWWISRLLSSKPCRLISCIIDEKLNFINLRLMVLNYHICLIFSSADEKQDVATVTDKIHIKTNVKIKTCHINFGFDICFLLKIVPKIKDCLIHKQKRL